MKTIKGKARICQSQIADFNIEQIGSSPFYKRYDEFIRIFNKYLEGENAEELFAQPLENESEETIDWFVPTDIADAGISSLESLKGTDLFDYYSGIRQNVIQRIAEVEHKMTPVELGFYQCAVRFAESEYIDQTTYCHADKVTFALWGMRMRKGRDPRTIITDDVREHRIHNVEYKIEGSGEIMGKSRITRKHGHILQGNVDIPMIKPCSHYRFTRWLPDAPQGKAVMTDVCYTALCERSDDYEIRFMVEEHGKINGDGIVRKKPGSALLQTDVPKVFPEPGFVLKGWMPQLPFNEPLSDDMVFYAQFEEVEEETIPFIPEPKCTVEFLQGDYGLLNGQTVFTVNKGTCLNAAMIPKVMPKKGYEFIGWNRNPAAPVDEDITLIALYKKIPWYRRFWMWLNGHLSWLKWLILILAILLLIALMILLMRSCRRHSIGGAVDWPEETLGTEGNGTNLYIDRTGKVLADTAALVNEEATADSLPVIVLEHDDPVVVTEPISPTEPVAPVPAHPVGPDIVVVETPAENHHQVISVPERIYYEPGTGRRRVIRPGNPDYDEIRRLIREYESRTRELKKLLPEYN